MRNDRFLQAIIGLIALIVVAAVALYFIRSSPQTYLPEDDPAGVVHNYALALDQEDYERAYSYLAAGENKPSSAEFRTEFGPRDRLDSFGLQILDTEILDDEAVVDLILIQGSSGPFESGWRNNDTARLVLEGENWKITWMPYPYWGFDWYNANRVPSN